MSTVNNSSYVIRLFSNASMDIFGSNTIASFTNRLAKPLLLSPEKEWLIGISQFYSPHIEQQNQVQKSRNDVFFFDSKIAVVDHIDTENPIIWKMEEFTYNLARQSPHKGELYTDSYFKYYLMENTHFSLSTFMKTHSKDFVLKPHQDQKEYTIYFDLAEFLKKEGETKEDFFAPNFSKEQVDSFNKFSTTFYCDVSYTGLQIIYTIILSYLLKFRYTMSSFASSGDEGIYGGYRKFEKKISEFALRIIKSFVLNLQKSLCEIHKISKYDVSSDILCVYSNVCELCYVGDKLSKVLGVFVLPGETTHDKNFFQPPNPTFVRLENLNLTDIKILICNQYGEKAKYSSGVIPSFIELIIKNTDIKNY